MAWLHSFLRGKAAARLAAAGSLAGCVAVLWLAAGVQPYACGLGTHEQLTHAPCLFLELTGWPCPTCGMTTSFAHMARLHVRQALLAQPFGALLFVLTAAWIPAAVYFFATGKRLRVPPNWALAGVLLLMIAGWAFKIVSFKNSL